MNYLKELFDDEDLKQLKNFVRECFEGDTKFYFPSGKIASGMTMGQVTKIAFELRNIAQQALDNMNSSEDEDDMDEQTIAKRQEIGKWQRFCKEKIDKLYKIWETKLGANERHSENDSDSDKKSDNNEEELEDDPQKRLDQIFANFDKLQHSKSVALNKEKSAKSNELKEDVTKGLQSLDPKPKDDSAIEEKSKESSEDYSDHQYWKTPDLYDLDELLKEQFE